MIDAAPLILDPLDDDVEPRDRRTHARIPVTELDGIREVRLKYGPPVSLIDLSAGGALLHTPVQLRPGSTQVLEIVGADVEIVPCHVLRCHVADLSKDGLVYRGACAFKRPIQVDARRRHRLAPRLDLTLKELAQAQRHTGASDGADPRPGRTLQRVLKTVQSAASGQDPLSRAVSHMLAELVPALDRGESMAAVRARLEECLRRALPRLTIALSTAPVRALPGNETIYFAGGAEADGHTIVNVELGAGSVIPDWQFRLLQASGYLVELLSLAGGEQPTERARRRERAVEIDARRETDPAACTAEASPDTKPGWQRIVVRYRRGELLKGYTLDFHPSRQQFSLWPTLDARPNEGIHIPTCLLKAIFFVRDFDGDPEYEPKQTFDDGTRRAGRRLEVTFEDGEVLVGTTLSYRADGIGFFVEPADERGNNQRVFVVGGAIRHVRFF
jgi:hypothetical protein